MQATRARVQRLETALAAMGESDSLEACALQNALKSAQPASEEKPVDVQVKECKAFISRSQNRLANLEKERAKEQEMLEAATARLARLREVASAGVPMQPPSCISPASEMEFARTGRRHGTRARRCLVCPSMQTASHITSRVFRACD